MARFKALLSLAWTATSAWAGPAATIPEFSLERQTAGDGPTLAVRLADSPRVFDWQIAATGIDAAPIVNLMDGLARINDHGGAEPALAKSWEFSSDFRTLTVTIHPDSRWSDGMPVKAQQFVDSWERLLNPQTRAPNPSALYSIRGAENYQQGRLKDFAQVGVKALDPLTLLISFDAPSPHFVLQLAQRQTFPIRRELIQRLGSEWSQPANLVTTGPFRLATHQAPGIIELRVNPQSRLPRGNLAILKFVTIPSDSEASRRFQAGELDILPRYTPEMGNASPNTTRVERFPAIRTVKLDLNTRLAPFNDPKARTALAQAIDMNAFGELKHQGYGAASSLIPPGLQGTGKDLRVPSNLPMAQASWRQLKGAPSTLRFLAPATDDYRKLLGFLSDSLKKTLGVSIQTDFRPIGEFNGAAFQDTKKYHAAVYGVSARSLDPQHFIESYESRSPNNHTGWVSAQYDALSRQMNAAPKKELRIALAHQAQNLLSQKAVVSIPLLWDGYWMLVSTQLSGYGKNHFNFFQFSRVTKGNTPRSQPAPRTSPSHQ